MFLLLYNVRLIFVILPNIKALDRESIMQCDNERSKTYSNRLSIINYPFPDSCQDYFLKLRGRLMDILRTQMLTPPKIREALTPPSTTMCAFQKLIVTNWRYLNVYSAPQPPDTLFHIPHTKGKRAVMYQKNNNLK